ncbi:efflux RND transporter periplasmic adaptor subunit [Singulisphaera sp. PoT]|uniref:efflux RND transporter periplasmic adaptor subunit n=1 Tax=Singulisphaera sp. PoT TaxID=3411797 RepID=UPI003BF536B8
MLLRKIKLAATAAGVVAVIAAGAVALAQPGTAQPKDPGGGAKGVEPANWTYHILVSRKDEPPRKVAVVEMIGDTPIRVEAPGASILISPRGDEERRVGDDGKEAGPSRVDGVRARRKIILTNPRVMDADVVQQYVAQIHAQRHINIRALENGFIRKIEVKEGQAVKEGDLMIEIEPPANRPKPAGDFGKIVAPFDGLVGSLNEQVGALVKEGENLTELSDNGAIWVYFKMPERQYLDYMAEREKREGDRVELVLANGARFSQNGKIGAIEANFDAATGAIAFRADFPNPDRVLRHGQTGTVLIHHKIPDAVVVPQRATFEILDKRYVYVVDKDEVAHQREITVSNELDDLFVIKKGVGVGDRIVLDGIREVRDGEKVDTDLRPAKKK